MRGPRSKAYLAPPAKQPPVRLQRPASPIEETGMAIWELMPDKIRPATPTSFDAAGIRERQDLQRLLGE